MNIIDKIMLRQFSSHTRESLLPVLLGKHKCGSGKWFRQRWYRLLLAGASNKVLFTLIHDKHLWDEKESVSGPGSTFDATRNIRAALPEIFETYNIKSVLDIPCGDFNWMQHVDLKGIDYTGADIVEELIEKNNRNFASDKRKFLVLDLTRDTLPGSDLVICRDGLVHLTDREISLALRNIKKSGAKYLFTTNLPIVLKMLNPGPTTGAPSIFSCYLSTFPNHC